MPNEMFNEIRELAKGDKAISQEAKDRLMLAAMADMSLIMEDMQGKVNKMYVLYQLLSLIGIFLTSAVSGIGAKVFLVKSK
jgi:hypothetical protein